MAFKKLQLAAGQRRAKNIKSPRIIVRGYVGEFNTLGREDLAQVCRAWGLPVNHPAALSLHTPEESVEYQLCSVPVMSVGDDDVPVSLNKTATKIRVDLYDYMNSINLHLGKRTKWVIYLKVAPGVDGKPCLYLDTKTDLAEIQKRQSAAHGAPDKSGQQTRT